MAFMTHPEHGAINVLSGEVEAHEKAGWNLSTHGEWLASKLDEPTTTNSAAVVSTEAPRRGRKQKAQ